MLVFVLNEATSMGKRFLGLNPSPPEGCHRSLEYLPPPRSSIVPFAAPSSAPAANEHHGETVKSTILHNHPRVIDFPKAAA
jgi:hypothetical protein